MKTPKRGGTFKNIAIGEHGSPGSIGIWLGSTCLGAAKRLFFPAMATVTLDETSRIESLLAAGELVFLSKAGKKLGVIIPAVEKAHGVPLPDFRSRLRQTWGSRVFSEVEVKAMREAELEHCHG